MGTGVYRMRDEEATSVVITTENGGADREQQEEEEEEEEEEVDGVEEHSIVKTTSQDKAMEDLYHDPF
ncbi:unnamed protein product [Lota lota]